MPDFQMGNKWAKNNLKRYWKRYRFFVFAVCKIKLEK